MCVATFSHSSVVYMFDGFFFFFRCLKIKRQCLVSVLSNNVRVSLKARVFFWVRRSTIANANELYFNPSKYCRWRFTLVGGNVVWASGACVCACKCCSSSLFPVLFSHPWCLRRSNCVSASVLCPLVTFHFRFYLLRSFILFFFYLCQKIQIMFNTYQWIIFRR